MHDTGHFLLHFLLHFNDNFTVLNAELNNNKLTNLHSYRLELLLREVGDYIIYNLFVFDISVLK
jgi:hypothetical protein